jgi:hypothetical protein
MARKTSSRQSTRNTKSSKKATISRGNIDKKRGGKSMSESVHKNDIHEPDCQRFLRNGTFLPPDLHDSDEIGQTQHAKQKS